MIKQIQQNTKHIQKDKIKRKQSVLKYFAIETHSFNKTQTKY